MRERNGQKLLMERGEKLKLRKQKAELGDHRTTGTGEAENEKQRTEDEGRRAVTSDQ